jgi:hypothetical protein
MQLNAQGHYYLLYTPADPSKYCWVLMDPQVESLLEITYVRGVDCWDFVSNIVLNVQPKTAPSNCRAFDGA